MDYSQTRKNRYRIVRLWHKLEQVNQEFYSTTDDTLKLINPTLTLEISGNGVLEFTMPYMHKYFKDVSPMIDEFMVRDEVTNETLFVGRPISCTVEDFERVKVYCEGALGYLHDILIRPKAWEHTTPVMFFKDIVTEYNARKGTKVPYQEIYIAEDCDIPNRDIYRYANYDKAYTLLERGCLESDGGYIFMTYEADGKKTIHWKQKPSDDEAVSQQIAFGTNIVSFNEELDLSEASSFAIVLGAESETEQLPGDMGAKRLELSEPVGLGLSGQGGTSGEWEWQWVIREYGYVEELFEYDEPKTQEELRAKFDADPAVKLSWPERQINVECEVADLHFLNNGITKFKLGDRINLSVPFKIYTRLADILYVTRIRYDLGSAIAEIIVGELPKRSLSDQFRRKADDGNDTSDLDRRVSKLERGMGGSSGGGVTDALYVYLGNAETTNPFNGGDIDYTYDFGDELNAGE